MDTGPERLPELGVVIYSSVRFLSIKTTKPKFWKKTKKKTETDSNRPVLVRFGFFCQKPEKTKTKISNAVSLKYVLNHNTISKNNQDIYKKLTIWIGF
jgi:hypothetical protein